MLLWPDGAPGALGTAVPGHSDAADAVFPDTNKATGAAMGHLSRRRLRDACPHEGATYAIWLKEQGIAAFVLKYRLGSAGYRHPIMLLDAARAVGSCRGERGGMEAGPETHRHHRVFGRRAIWLRPC